jgi:hypothetical protein
VTSAKRIAAAALLGGTTSALTGGKFANGAITGAFSRAFNDEAHRKSVYRVKSYAKQLREIEEFEFTEDDAIAAYKAAFIGSMRSQIEKVLSENGSLTQEQIDFSLEIAIVLSVSVSVSVSGTEISDIGESGLAGFMGKTKYVLKKVVSFEYWEQDLDDVMDNIQERDYGGWDAAAAAIQYSTAGARSNISGGYDKMLYFHRRFYGN